MLNFDLDVLRSFKVGVELGSFAKAADRLGRSTSAISAQLKKLEEQAGTKIFRKSGRGLALTEAGDTLLSYARKMLELNDEAASAMQPVKLAGSVRLGLQQDFGETLLPEVLGRFARAHPNVKIEARLARNAEMFDAINAGELDLALAWEYGEKAAHCETVANLPMCWIGSSKHGLPWLQREHVQRSATDEPLPLAAFEGRCHFRLSATAALDQAGIPWRVAFTSPGLAGLWAGTAAGLGLTIRTRLGLPASVQPLDHKAYQLPELPSIALSLYRQEAQPDPLNARLREILLDAVQEEIFKLQG